MGIADAPLAQSARDETIQLVTFLLADEEYAFRIVDVQEIIRMRNLRITAIPNAPRFVEGVINLRGRMIPVVDLRSRFGMTADERGRTNRVVVLNVSDRTVGAVVDAVVEVIRVTEASIECLPDLVASIDGGFIQGIARVDERMVIALDIHAMFNTDETESIDKLAGEASVSQKEVAQ